LDSTIHIDSAFLKFADDISRLNQYRGIAKLRADSVDCRHFNEQLLQMTDHLRTPSMPIPALLAMAIHNFMLAFVIVE
jgi:hypothetical protein